MPAVTKSITLQEDKPSLRVTSGVRAATFLRRQSDFAILEVLNPSEIALFRYFQHVRPTTGATMQTLVGFKLFLYPMDRAEVLHTPSYNLSGRRKNTPGENDQVNSCEIFNFPSKFYA